MTATMTKTMMLKMMICQLQPSQMMMKKMIVLHPGDSNRAGAIGTVCGQHAYMPRYTSSCHCYIWVVAVANQGETHVLLFKGACQTFPTHA